MRTVFALFAFLILLSPSFVHSQITSAQVDSLVQEAMEKFEVAGAAVAIVKDGKVIHQKGYGVQSIETNTPVSEISNFAIASNTKAFTTVALAILEEEGKINWDDKVIKHLPEFRMYNDYVTENFNIQDLLTHRSGLGLGAGDLMFFPDGANFTIGDVLGVFQYFEPVSDFRTKYDYDNVLYLVAGELIARVSGMSYDDFISKKILKPLKMDNSAPSLQKITNKNMLAMPHTTADGGIREIPHIIKSINGAAGGMFSNVSDMAIWMNLQLNKGEYGNGQRLFSEENHREMWKVHTVIEPNRYERYNSHFAGYGLGWFLADKKGDLEVSHTGGLPGMLSKVAMLPDRDLGVVVLTNTESGGAGVFSTVVNTILDSYMGLDDNNWLELNLQNARNREGQGDEITKKTWETVKKADQSSVIAENYLGIYRDNWFGDVVVHRKDGQLWISSKRSPKLNGPLKLYKDHTFAVKWEYQDMNADAFAIFEIDDKGKAQNLKMKGISPNIDFSFDFQDLDLKRVE
ncbi:serine hydrolase [Antarcticibacterium flavum]|uniref:Serine hydrolase n=1 Tax=Antarcticibacterium flavum TaxID=2058175 RepID=A0A5B7X4L5_9FLAO|nr:MULTISPECIES: serine hydrolase [Antarcticibacterium]MCM4158532.1 serine hydrolase [Antarcticibacterium sp. W02-3]QCY70279.1 serine hydrolase [Antarcticibacterium flavum]